MHTGVGILGSAAGRAAAWRKGQSGVWLRCLQADLAEDEKLQLTGELDAETLKLPAGYHWCGPKLGWLPLHGRHGAGSHPQASHARSIALARPRRYETMMILKPTLSDEERWVQTGGGLSEVATRGPAASALPSRPRR